MIAIIDVKKTHLKELINERISTSVKKIKKDK